jgi:hypothetical protein
VDLRLTFLLYLGSLVGIHLGTYGVKVVNEKMIRLATAVIILLCVLSRGIAIPAYLRQLKFLAIDARWDAYCNGASKAMLYASGIAGCGLILYNVFRAYRQRRKLQSTFGIPRPLAT